MKLRAILNGIAALCAIGVFYTFTFCMVDDVDDAEISKEYYYNTATETEPTETEPTETKPAKTELIKAEIPQNNSVRTVNNIEWLPNSLEDQQVNSRFEAPADYQASPASEDTYDEAEYSGATPIHTAAEVTTAVPEDTEEFSATESAGADNTPSETAAPADNFNYEAVPEESDEDMIFSENYLSEAVVDNNSAYAYETGSDPDLLSELDRQQTEEDIIQKLNEMQAEYDTTPAPVDTTTFWSSYYPNETTPISSMGTYFETVPTFTDTEPVQTELTTIAPNGAEMFTAKFDGSVQEINAYDLVCMIVSTEMSPSFSPEALKAQAVAAYSYVKYHNVNGLVPSVLVKHTIPDEVRNAVDAVFGKCCYYNGEVAQTVYTASSAGRSASSENVWGGKVPYLVSVEAPFDAVSDPNYGVITTFTENDMRQALEGYLGITLSDDPSNWLTVTERVDGNYVSSVNVDGQTYISGRKLRENVLKFSLKSWSFDVSYADGIFTFVTYGYGHGVGMSQNGANILAKQGYTYDQILRYYFTGITVS
ncbi:MAG: SpoIID/LytB domain-containing protein [Oscillospiraceae bacterium]|nr:SpoIID/LytB domain-containing protein [Oscillospiraceae bacterium]